MTPGTPVELTAAWGLAPAEVEKISKNPAPALSVRLTGPFVAPETVSGPELGLALIRGPRFDWAVEKAAELGCTRLVPLTLARSVPLGRGADRRLRWGRLAEEARKQCGRPTPMIVAEPASLADWLAERPAQGPPGLLMDLSAAPFPVDANPRSALLVGPEGGLTAEEKNLAMERGFEPVSLGRATLRSETAALAALARLALR
jgi:16S rRNA (uracil1498-N3)-methyltransferase